jgi:hypothetical protein
LLEEKCTRWVECHHRKGEQDWWKIKVVPVIPEMEHQTSRGLSEMKQIRPGKNEEMEDDTAQPTHVSAREMNIASVVQSFPILNLKYSRCGFQTSMIEPECANDIVSNLLRFIGEDVCIYRYR